MDRLSSCYFCGAALDASLEERPVVPAELHPSTDSQKTVVLCLTCQRKLDAVLDTVLDAVEAGDVAPDAGATDAGETSADRTPAQRGVDDASTGADSPASDDLESTLGDDEDILAPIGEEDDAGGGDAADAANRAEATDDSDADSGDESADDRSKKPKYTNSRGAGFRREDDGPVETGSLTGGAFSDDDENDAGGGSASGGRSASSGQSDGPAGSGSASANDGGRSSADDGGRTSSDDAGGSSTDDGASGQQRDVSMTRLENTKVMRLLENREFPVDREEFVTVAANAYQVSREDCDKVIDLAVEHDLLREENGQLYDGDS